MLYLGLYDEAGSKREGPLLIAPDEAASLLPSELRLAVGSGAAPSRRSGERGAGIRVEAKLAELQPSAEALAEIASESGETCSYASAALFASARRQAANASACRGG